MINLFFAVEMLDMFVDARLFALECVRILVEEHGARRDGIDIGHFYYTAIGQQIGAKLDGKTIRSQRSMVADAMLNLWPWVVGLAPAGPEQQARIDATWKEVLK